MKNLTEPTLVPSPLADADLASRDPLAAEARATTPAPAAAFAAAWSRGDEAGMSEAVVAALYDVDPDEFRADLVTAYVRAGAAGAWDEELRLLKEAAAFDLAHPDDEPLHDELLATGQYSEVA